MIRIRGHKHFYKYIIFATFLFGFFLLGGNFFKLKAATCTWTGADDEFWSTGTNWDCGGLGDGDTLIFPTGASTFSTVNDIDPGTYDFFQDIFIQTDSYTFSGSDVNIFGVLQFEGVGQDLDFGLNIVSTGAYLSLKVVDADSTMNILGGISNNTDLYKQFAGRVILSGESVGNFPLHIQEGTLVANSSDALSNYSLIEVDSSTLALATGVSTSSPIDLNGIISVNSGASNFSGDIVVLNSSTINGDLGSLNLSGIISGSENLNKDGAHTLYFTGSAGNTFTGQFFINQGDVIALKSVGLAIPSSDIHIGDGLGGVDSARLLVQANDQFNSLASLEILQDGFMAYENTGTTNNISNLTLTQGHAKITGTTVISGDLIIHGGTLEGYDTAAISASSMVCSNYNTQRGRLTGDGWTFTNADMLVIGEYTNGIVQCEFNSHIHGGADFLIQGRIMRFNGNNDFTGSVTVDTESILELGNSNALGNASTGTTVLNDGSLSLYNNINVASEPLTLNGGIVDIYGSLATSSDTNTFGGPITLQGTSDVYITTIAEGILTISGSMTNSTTAKLIFQKIGSGGGLIQLAVANSFTAASIDIIDVIVRKTASVNVFPDTLGIFINGGGNFDLNSFSETVGSLAGDSGALVTLGNATFSIGSNNNNTTYNGLITGNGGITKIGTGALTLTGNNNYTGTTNISNGKLIVNGLQSSSNVSLNSTGILGGSGRVGVITGGGTGAIAPGNSPGILSVTGNVAFANTNSFNVELNGTTVGSQYDQLNVTGSVNLNSATLNVSLGFTPNSGDSFTIVQSSGVLIGTFNGLPNGSTFTVGGNTLRIDYGTNSVVITVNNGGGNGGSGGSNGNGSGDGLAETGITIPLIALVFLVSTTAVVVFTNKYVQKKKRLNKNFR